MRSLKSRFDQLRAALTKVPGLERLVLEAARIDIVDRCLAIGAQALLALLPFVVVLSAWAPADLGDFIVARLRDATGLDRTAAASLVQFGVDTGSSTVQTGLVGLLVALVSATSFSRVLQRMYVRVFELGNERRPGRIRLSVVWLGVWFLNLALLACVGRWAGGPVVTWSLSLIVQVCFWWWTARAMLLGSRSWMEVLPVALMTTAGSAALVMASSYVMPRYARSSIVQFGGFGAVIALATWLVAFAGVLVLGSLIGRLVAEHPKWDAVIDRARRARSRMTGQRQHDT
jgi:membrane protein